MSSGTMRSLKKQVASRDNNCCYVCGREAEDDETYDLEHIRPISQGGSTRDLDNLGLICREDHATKSRAETAAANRQRAQTRHPTPG